MPHYGLTSYRVSVVLGHFYFMAFEDDYNQFLRFAKERIIRLKLNTDPNDIINDAYIKFVDSGKDYSPKTIVGFIIGLSEERKGYEVMNIGNKDSGFSKRTNHTCKVCKEKKPVSGFYLINKNTIIIPQTTCKECQLKKAKERYQKQKDKILARGTAYKKINKDKIRKKKRNYYLKNREFKPKVGRVGLGKVVSKNRKINESLHYNKQRDQLTDWYIRKILSRHSDITPEKIEEKRQEILLKKLAITDK